MTADLTNCPSCGKDLPANAPSGICPTCLMKAAVMNPIEPEPTVTPHPVQRFVPPEITELSEQLSQLEVFHLIGTGGMGAVYKARQIKLDRIVALKVLRPESSDDAAFAQRFNREAKTLARLSHPNVVGVHDFGEIKIATADGGSQTLFYFVMEYVDGSDLRQIMGAEIPPADVLSIVNQVCKALQYAHEQGIVHRDIKPENILLDSHGHVKIADFGLAKLASKTERDYTLTGTHQVMGTPRYMAPEQMEGSRTVDHRADVYSLGVVFYELLTGEIPMGQFAPPSEKSSVDGGIDSVVLKAMAREPDRRYQSADEMFRELTDSSMSASVVTSATPQPLPGPSTILDMGARKAVDGLKRGVTGKFRLPLVVPGIIALIVSLSTITAHGLYLATNSAGNSFELVISALIVLFVLTLILLAFGVQTSRARWRPYCVFLAGTAVAILNIVCILDDERLLNTFYSNMMLGGSLGLMVVAALDFRLHIADSRNNKSARARAKKRPEVAHIGFVVPSQKSPSQYVAPHFQMLGYMLVDQTSDEWIFERGSVFGHMGIDLRKCHTTLTVRTGPRPDGSIWVSCGWSVQAFVSGSEVKKLEAEGQSFATALGVETVSLTETGSSQNVRTPQSVVSVLGGSSRSGEWKASSHMNVYGILGACDVDFSKAELEPGTTTVNVFCLLAAVNIVVPPYVTVEVTGAGVLGLFEHTAEATPPAVQQTHKLRVTGVSVMGGVHVEGKA